MGKHQKNGFEVYAQLYINICSDGQTRFGTVGVDGGNAICLLEPIFILGQKLTRMATG